MRVLVVEDNPILAQSLSDALTAARFAVGHMAYGRRRISAPAHRPKIVCR